MPGLECSTALRNNLLISVSSHRAAPAPLNRAAAAIVKSDRRLKRRTGRTGRSVSGRQQRLRRRSILKFSSGFERLRSFKIPLSLREEITGKIHRHLGFALKNVSQFLLRTFNPWWFARFSGPEPVPIPSNSTFSNNSEDISRRYFSWHRWSLFGAIWMSFLSLELAMKSKNSKCLKVIRSFIA